MVATMSSHPATALETAAEYQDAGLWSDGLAVLSRLAESAPDGSRVSPLIDYDLAYFADKLGRGEDAAGFRRRAGGRSPDRVFPFQSESVAVLRAAIASNPNDARAHYYLGNLLFDWQPDEAVTLWETSAALDPTFPMVHRNLAIAYSHRPRGNDPGKAIAHLERAVALPNGDALHLAELDELYEAAGTPLERRLAVMEAHHPLVVQRDDALAREIGLKIAAGRYDEAIRLLTGRQFAVWEGGDCAWPTTGRRPTSCAG